MPANPIDVARLHATMKLHVDGVRPRRFSTVAGRREWYAASRRVRYGRYLSILAK